MRITRRFIIGPGLGLAAALMAQDLPKSSFDLNVGSEENLSAGTETNETEVVLTEEQLLAGKLSFLTDTAVQYADEGEHEEAERAYLRALEADPDNVGLRFRLSTLYIMMDRYTEALALLRALAEEHPDDAQIHNNLAWCYATGPGVKNKKLALRHAREALLLAPESPHIWNTLAEAYYMAGNYERALRSSGRAIDLLTHYANMETKMREFQEQQRKILRAQQAFKQLEGLYDE